MGLGHRGSSLNRYFYFIIFISYFTLQKHFLIVLVNDNKPSLKATMHRYNNSTLMSKCIHRVIRHLNVSVHFPSLMQVMKSLERQSNTVSRHIQAQHHQLAGYATGAASAVMIQHRPGSPTAEH